MAPSPTKLGERPASQGAVQRPASQGSMQRPASQGALRRPSSSSEGRPISRGAARVQVDVGERNALSQTNVWSLPTLPTADSLGSLGPTPHSKASTSPAKPAQRPDEALCRENVELTRRILAVVSTLPKEMQGPFMDELRTLVPGQNMLSEPEVDFAWYDEMITRNMKKSNSVAASIRIKYQRLCPRDQIKKELLVDVVSTSMQNPEMQKMQRVVSQRQKEKATLEVQVERLAGANRALAAEVKNLTLELHTAEKDLLAKRHEAQNFKNETEELGKEVEGLHEGFNLVPDPGDDELADDYNEEPVPGSPQGNSKTLRGLRINLYQQMKENRELLARLSRERKQKRLFEAKLKATQHELRRVWQSGATLDEKLFQKLTEEGEAKGAQLLRGEDDEGEDPGAGSINKSRTLIRKSKHYSQEYDDSKVYVPLSREECDSLELDFARHVMKSHGKGALQYLDGLDKPEERARCIRFLAREFGIYHQRTSRMQVLVQDLQEMNRITDLDVGVRFAMQTMCKTLVCDRSVYWVIDERRQSAWTRMPDDSGKMNVVAIPLTTGFVSVCHSTKRAVNVADAYADPRFSRAYDVRTGYRTKAVLSIPVLQHDKVKAVLQCTNKLSASTTVFDDEDVFVLYVIGHSMANVVTNCEKHKDTMHATRRRDTLLAAAEDFFLRCRSKRDLLTMLRERMAHLFHAQDCILALVYQQKLERIDLDLDGNIHTREHQLGTGLLGACVENKIPLHVERPRGDRRFHPSSDIGIQGSQRLHSWPMSFGDTITAVVQFTQAERSGIQFGDDGSFDEANQTHLDLMSRFLAMVQFFVEKWWPSDERLGKKEAPKAGEAGHGYRKLRAYQVFKKLLGGESWEKDVEARATSTIQRYIRRRLSTQSLRNSEVEEDSEAASKRLQQQVSFQGAVNEADEECQNDDEDHVDDAPQISITVSRASQQTKTDTSKNGAIDEDVAKDELNDAINSTNDEMQKATDEPNDAMNSMNDEDQKANDAINSTNDEMQKGTDEPNDAMNSMNDEEQKAIDEMLNDEKAMDDLNDAMNSTNDETAAKDEAALPGRFEEESARAEAKKKKEEDVRDKARRSFEGGFNTGELQAKMAGDAAKDEAARDSNGNEALEEAVSDPRGAVE